MGRRGVSSAALTVLGSGQGDGGGDQRWISAPHPGGPEYDGWRDPERDDCGPDRRTLS